MKKATLALVVLVVVAVLAAAVFVSIAVRDRAIFGSGEDCSCGGGIEDDYDMYNYAGPGDSAAGEGASSGHVDAEGGFAGDDIRGDNAGYTGGAERLFRLPAREPWYGEIVKKKSGVLFRLARPPFTTLTTGTQVQFVRSRPLGDTSTHATPRCTAKITKIDKFPSFVAALEKANLPASGAEQLYMNRDADMIVEKENGVFAITLSDVAPEAPRAGLMTGTSRPARPMAARRVGRRKIKRGRAEDYGAPSAHSAHNVFDSVWAN